MSHATAAAIRGATDSETIDLAGHSSYNITKLTRDAFAEPLPLSHMIRLTFITGAGKLGRQKYDDGAAKALTSTLRELGYEEDRAASAVVECQGTFKSQHDTGKNLKTIVVFPQITSDSGGGGGDLDGDLGQLGALTINDDGSNPLLPEGTPEHMVVASSMGVFERNWKPKCVAWKQKKNCLKALESIRTTLDELDAKLLSGTPLTDAEQDLFDTVSGDDLAKKEAVVKKEMQAQVEAGLLTKAEKAMLLDQVEKKIETIKTELDEATREGKAKKKEKLLAMREKATARADMLEKISPVSPHKLKHEPEIQKLRAELRPLQKLENNAKGRLLSVKETTALGKKEEILEQIGHLEEASRGWFEDDDAFSARVEYWRSVAKGREKSKGTGKKSSGGGAGSGGFKPAGKTTTKFITPGTKKGWGKPASSKKKATGGGSVFSAMMMDSDSD